MTEHFLAKNILNDVEELSKDATNLRNRSIFYTDGREVSVLATPLARKISALRFREARLNGLGKEKIFAICEELLETGNVSTREVAFDWAFRMQKSFDEYDFAVLESWLERYVDGWGACDDLCTHALGIFIFQFPNFLPKIKQWARSENRWKRRASAVALIYGLRRGKYLQEVLEVSEMLFDDQEDLVQKGFGWALKEASKHFPDEVFDFVMQNKSRMTRTALRYAIEKLPKEKRLEAMK